MDPNANIREMRQTYRAILKCEGHGASDVCEQCAENGVRLATLIESLECWIEKGGFLPDSWEIAQKKAKG